MRYSVCLRFEANERAAENLAAHLLDLVVEDPDVDYIRSSLAEVWSSGGDEVYTTLAEPVMSVEQLALYREDA